MQNKKIYTLSEKMINRIISVAYDDAGLLDKLVIRSLAKKDDKIKQILESQKAIAREVHKIEEEVFPQEILNTMGKKNLNDFGIKNNFMADLLNIVFTRPLISAAATIVLVGMIIISLMQNRTIEYKYTQTEIETAQKNAKIAFDIIGKIFNETKLTLSNEIIGEKVGKPINESYGIINNLFKKGEKQ